MLTTGKVLSSVASGSMKYLCMWFIHVNKFKVAVYQPNLNNLSQLRNYLLYVGN
jgi:hypothetical protein